MKQRFLLLMGLIISLGLSTINGYASNNQRETRYVTSDLNFRQNPNTLSDVIMVIPAGTTVDIDENCDCEWIPIEYKGQIGYVTTKYLAKTSSESSKASIDLYPLAKKSGNGVESHHFASANFTATAAPAGATALCKDGTYSYSKNRRGTCSHHGGVARWL